MPLDAPTDRQMGELQTCGRLEFWRSGAENRSLGVGRGVRPVSGRWGRSGGSRRVRRAIADCLQFSAYACKREQALCQLLHLLDDLPRPGLSVRSSAYHQGLCLLPYSSHPASCWRRSHRQGGLSRAQATLVFSSRHSTVFTGSVDACLQAWQPERPLSGFSDSCRRAGGCRPPTHATESQQTSAVASGRHRHAWLLAPQISAARNCTGSRW